MSESIVLYGFGHLSPYTGEVASRHGATMVNYTDAECGCGFGCRPFLCPNSKRHWFVVKDHGGGSLRDTTDRLTDALVRSGLLSSRFREAPVGM